MPAEGTRGRIRGHVVTQNRIDAAGTRTRRRPQRKDPRSASTSRTLVPTPGPVYAIPTPQCMSPRRRGSSPRDAADCIHASATRGYKHTTQLHRPRRSTRRVGSAHEHEHGPTAAASSGHRRISARIDAQLGPAIRAIADKEERWGGQGNA
ncbi:hypothetical protein DFH09DRAFT_1202649 [Mycena vulgaris]|nr:hypothetical protein DFH09DRAFT_1202649 [Mycena vulgaris]